MVSDMKTLPKQDILKKYNFNETDDWNLEEQRQYFSNCKDIDIQKVNYRPFEYRFTFYPLDSISKIIPRGDSRKGLMQHFRSGENLGLLTCRQQSTFDFQHVFVSRLISDMCSISLQTKETGYVFPLYLYPESSQQQSLDESSDRKPNLNPDLVKEIAAKLGLTFVAEKQSDDTTFAPIDLLDYIYAVLHSPRYRETYKEFLKIDFPRVPYPEKENFWQRVKLGGELRQLHLLESPLLENSQLKTTYPASGDNLVSRKIHKSDYEITGENSGRLWINDRQYFDNVPQTAWEFYIGGYQPAQKWLKDRNGRTLNREDILHYRKIIQALSETERLMQEIEL